MSDSPASKALTLPRLPRGFADRGPGELAVQRQMLETIRQVYELYGFEAVETPFVEYTDALGKFLPDTDRPNAGVFSFRDDDEQWLSLRYDLTAPLARHVAEHYERLPKPYRSYRAGYVFRNEKPGPGRFRQFMQFDADTVGSASPAADAEICMMAADTMERLGIARGDYVVKVNNRKLLDGVLGAIGLDGDANAGRRLTVLRAIDKLDRLGIEGVKQLLGAGRKDESGDFTKGAELDEAKIALILRRISTDLIGDVSNGVLLQGNVVDVGTRPHHEILESEGLAELSQIQSLVRASGYGPDRIRIDPSVVRGLEYYTGPVFEVELTFEVKDEDGRTVRFGSVAGGGRYDGLVGRFREGEVPATGFSIGVSRLLAALSALGKAEAARHAGPVVVTVMERDRLADYQKLVALLRQAGIAAELYLGEAGLKAQMKYADRRGSRVAILQGSNEREKDEVQIKDLVLGATLADTKDRAEYLAKQAEAQFQVPVAEMVDAVRKVLARHG